MKRKTYLLASLQQQVSGWNKWVIEN